MSTIRAKNRSKTQQAMSHAERQRRYRQAHGRGTVDLSRETWAVLRRIRDLRDRSNDQNILDALIVFEQQISEQPEPAERILDAADSRSAQCVNQELAGHGKSEAAKASIKVDAAPDRDPSAEAPRAIASDADPLSATHSASSGYRAKNVGSTTAARRDASTREDRKPKVTHDADVGAETTSPSQSLSSGRKTKNKAPANQTEMNLWDS